MWIYSSSLSCSPTSAIFCVYAQFSFEHKTLILSSSAKGQWHTILQNGEHRMNTKNILESYGNMFVFFSFLIDLMFMGDVLFSKTSV